MSQHNQPQAKAIAIPQDNSTVMKAGASVLFAAAALMAAQQMAHTASAPVSEPIVSVLDLAR
jgi:hypothetical protein